MEHFLLGLVLTLAIEVPSIIAQNFAPTPEWQKVSTPYQRGTETSVSHTEERLEAGTGSSGESAADTGADAASTWTNEQAFLL